MKKAKQIFAIIGIVLLVSLYVITLICAITDNSGTMQVFLASVVATVIFPVLIWTYTFIYKLMKNRDESDFSEDEAAYTDDDTDEES